MFFLVIRNSSNKRRIGGAALIRGWRLLTFLSQMRRLFEGGAYSRKYGIVSRCLESMMKDEARVFDRASQTVPHSPEI